MEGLKKLRVRKNWSQAKLAVEAGLDPSTVNQIETGVRGPNTKTLEKLAAALDVEVSALFEGHRVPKAQAPLPFNDDGQEQRRSPFLEAWVGYMNRRAAEWDLVLKDRLDRAEELGRLENPFEVDAWVEQAQTEAHMLFAAAGDAVDRCEPVELTEDQLIELENACLRILQTVDRWQEAAEEAWDAADRYAERHAERLEEEKRLRERGREASKAGEKVTNLLSERRAA